MSRMSSEFGLIRHTLSGPVMGTRWQALFHLPEGISAEPVRAAMEVAVRRVDAQMSAWIETSDLNRFNRTAPGIWVDLPPEMMAVLDLGLTVGRLSRGAFDIALGSVTRAWGFGPDPADGSAIRDEITGGRRPPGHELVELDLPNGRARAHAPLALDLNGIAKGFGADRLAEAARMQGISAGVFGIDGELRVLGSRPDGRGWPIVLEKPDYEIRDGLKLIELEAAAIATSGDYRHWVDLGETRLPHTMDPARRAPLPEGPASVTVIANACAAADAWATAFTVLGERAGGEIARDLGLEVLFLRRDGLGGFTETFIEGRKTPVRRH
ncbi:FAD:protein FMN transferase [Thioclava atlantica]|nr:FAD:protein FMN transferase [Thioclava atlantica]